jgi:fluoroacetyl-CoA thioesterase
VPVKAGLTSVVEHVVADADTAISLNSGSVAVLATPRVVGLCEEASIRAIANVLDTGNTSVGVNVTIDHLAPTAVGHQVRAEATVEKVDGRRIIFRVSVHDDRGLVAAGRVTRVVVDTERFLERTH